MKIPFDIKYRPQIESGEYKVEIGRDDPWPARIVCWDFDGNNLIVAVRNPNDREEGLIYSIDGKHKAVCPKIDSDLFLITPEPELTEFEKALSKCLCDAVVRPEEEDYDKWAKEYAPELLELARKELIEEQLTSDPRKTDLYKLGKFEALKHLPRWKKADRDWDAGSIDFAVFHRNDGGDHEDWFSVEVTNRLYKGEYYIELSVLEKLPKGE